MKFYDWLLFLHVAAAFATVASVVVFGTLLTVSWRAETAREASPMLGLWRLGFMLWNVGGLSVLVLGVWLAIDNSSVEPWDGWVIAAYVLWAIASFAGSRVAVGYREAVEGDGATLAATVRSQAGIALYALMAAATLALLAVMIYKPGA